MLPGPGLALRFPRRPPLELHRGGASVAAVVCFPSAPRAAVGQRGKAMTFDSHTPALTVARNAVIGTGCGHLLAAAGVAV